MLAPLGSAGETYPSYAHAVNLAAKYKITLSPADLEAAEQWVKDPLNAKSIANAFKKRGVNNFIVIKDPSLKYRIQYYGPERAYAKCCQLVAMGGYRVISFYVHLFSRGAFARASSVVSNKNDVLSYYWSKRKKCPYHNVFAEADLLKEKELIESLKDIPEDMQYTRRKV